MASAARAGTAPPPAALLLDTSILFPLPSLHQQLGADNLFSTTPFFLAPEGEGATTAASSPPLLARDRLLTPPVTGIRHHIWGRQFLRLSFSMISLLTTSSSRQQLPSLSSSDPAPFPPPFALA